MSDKLWKASERVLAKRLGGRRTGPSGRAGPDVVADWLQVEVKTRKRLPIWLGDALRQARVGCPEYRLPIAILHQVGQRHDGDLVVMALSDFEVWFGPVAGEET
jgi:hypothetical protein